MPPLVASLRYWAHETFIDRNGWPISQVKFVGNSFFLITFQEAYHRTASLKATPWYMFRRFVFTAPWSPDFNVQKEFQDKILVWIELPYQAVTLEDSQREVIKCLGPILHFVQDDEVSSYPHDRVCIL